MSGNKRVLIDPALEQKEGHGMSEEYTAEQPAWSEAIAEVESANNGLVAAWNRLRLILVQRSQDQELIRACDIVHEAQKDVETAVAGAVKTMKDWNVWLADVIQYNRLSPTNLEQIVGLLRSLREAPPQPLQP